MPDTYTPERDITPSFLLKVAEWIHSSGEVMVVLRYLRASGAKDFVLCRSFHDFKDIVSRQDIGCDIEVFREPHLLIRGVIDVDFIARALASIPDGMDYLIMTEEKYDNSYLAKDRDQGDSHEELLEILNELMGQEVALGSMPEYHLPDYEGLIFASKGGIDGPR